ncbi:response regulator transcription factor [Lentibacillus salinarum]|uniref:Response regulator transcription factor n=1 Tax=Lentibacillus salinarum TaxID=446820 RepID=A0ABW3ZPX9_9BACI
MGTIAIMKESGILRDGVQKVIKENFPEYVVSVYDSRHQNALFKESCLIDLMIIDMDIGINALRLIDYFSEKQTKTAIWISEVENDTLVKLFKKGLDGYFFNGMKSNELIFAIESMLNGRLYIHPFLSPILLNDYIKTTYNKVKRPNGILTEREWDILEQIVKGNKNSDIAEKLFISQKTVKNHLLSIFKKLNVTDRTNAALLAVKNNWFAL